MDIIKNQEVHFNYLELRDTVAFETAITKESLEDMRLVLRAYGKEPSFEMASSLITMGWDYRKSRMSEDELAERENLEFKRQQELNQFL